MASAISFRIRFGIAAGVLVSALFVGAVVTSAQRMPSVSASHATVARPYPARAVRPVSHRTLTSVSASSRAVANGIFFGGASSLSLQQLLDPVPPPGFDYTYLAAIDSDLGIKAFIDPATQMRLAAAQRFHRGNRGFTGSGFYILDGGGYYLPDESAPADQSSPQQPPPQIIVLQQAPAAPPAETEPESQPPVEESAPLPDVGEFTLVLRNGSQIQAVAFTLSNGKIVYITAEGSRRTIAAADLDSEATERLNEERGTPLQLPL